MIQVSQVDAREAQKMPRRTCLAGACIRACLRARAGMPQTAACISCRLLALASFTLSTSAVLSAVCVGKKNYTHFTAYHYVRVREIVAAGSDRGLRHSLVHRLDVGYLYIIIIIIILYSTRI